MFLSFRSVCSWILGACRVALATLLLPGLSSTAFAQVTHLWTQSRFEEFEKGTPDGVSITSDGRLHEGPALREIVTTPSTFVWSVAADMNGTAYLATGSPAAVLRVDKSGKPFTLFETRELNVQVVRLGPDGQLYVATLPSGRVYKLDPNSSEKLTDQKATVVFDAAKIDAAAEASSAAPRKDDSASDEKAETKSHYIWDMTFDPAGRLYIATGGPAAVYRVDPTKPGEKPELFFKSDEQHIRTLAWDAHGNLIAGSDGSGLVYRINEQGKGYVLFDAPHREITSIAVGADGTIFAANVGDKSHNPLPPLPVQGVGTVSITIVQPGSLQAANASTSLPEGTEIYALREGEAPRKLWAGRDDIVYALAVDADGLIALSGNRGHIFRILANGDYEDVAHLDAQQGLSLTKTNSELLIGTGNTGKLFKLGATEKHEYASDVLDAGALARFGRVEVEPASNGYELWTRSGNVEQPVRGWTDWERVKDGEVVSPAGRFLQWKVVLNKGGDIGGVGVNYLPVNAAPVVDEMIVVPGARVNMQNQPISSQAITISLPSANSQGGSSSLDASVSTPLPATKDHTAITVRWAAHDDNGDDLTYSLYLRGDGEHVWRLLKDDLTDKAYSFDAALIPDGGYQIKVIASDAPSHSPGEALTGMKISDRFEVDTTPPVVTGLTAVEEAAQCSQPSCPKPVRISFDATDAQSPIAHAEYSLDAGPWKFIAPVGELSDSKHEHYDLHLPASALGGKTGEHLLTVRAYDRYDNVGVAKTVFGSASK